MNVLLVDDEVLLVKGLKKSLELEGYQVYTAYDGREALVTLEKEPIEFIILDIMLPKIDGMTLCKRIREKMDIPIIMLTAKDDDIDKILGLELGADDYMTKPFNTRELITRIKVIQRRLEKQSPNFPIYSTGPLTLNALERRVFLKEKELYLTMREFDLLYLLIKNKGQVFSRDELFDLIWNEPMLDTRNIDVHIRNLREKIEENSSQPKFIKTKWGVGYYFNKDIEE
ncbi:response regulator transcription factor [Irregularibacter muris]|uniref:Stage 0 sporulation protein A homolog n=1 Tax=Irregularibacter muris TaxID=1796619 RepID=A0AAE3HH31_9FIRM|nr:response regulator transcription factor [Irregularibacter muris]MCR1898993.1 response regulator transcription factor [Irregularibacter muris]